MQANKIIKMLILDVDGVMTDGKIYLDHHGGESKVFHTQDGIGLKKLQHLGVVLAIISGRSSPAVNLRMQSLQIEHVYQNIADKTAVFQTLLQKLSLTPNQVAYIGDDLPDLPVMQQVALPLTVANAVNEIKSLARYVSQRKGGEGGVREICDWMIHHQWIATADDSLPIDFATAHE